MATEPTKRCRDCKGPLLDKGDHLWWCPSCETFLDTLPIRSKTDRDRDGSPLDRTEQR